MPATVRSCMVALSLLVTASPALAQWTRVLEVPETDLYSVSSNGDTLAAAADSIVYVSTDAGATWKTSVKVAAGVTSIQGVLVRNGRLYAGTYGQGVFVSTDLGDSWVAYNQGLTGGIFGTHDFTSDLIAHGDSLYFATSGAGVYVRNLTAGNWSHFGEQFEPNQSSNLNAIAAGGSHLLACGGFNGMAFFRDPGDADWTLSWLDNNGLLPGLAPLSAIWTGGGWVVGSNIGVFTSADGRNPWTFVDTGHGTLFSAALATRGRHVFAAFGIGSATFIEHSDDDGATWQPLEQQDFIFVYELATSGSTLYAARADGLWRRATADVSVPPGRPAALRFAIAGRQPVGDQVRFRFELPEAGSAVLEVFDLAGRRAAEPIEGSWPAGPHEVTLDSRALAPGVYAARLSARGRQERIRIVRVP